MNLIVYHLGFKLPRLMQYWKVLLYWHEYLADKHDDLETSTKILKFLTLMSGFLVQGQVSKFL